MIVAQRLIALIRGWQRSCFIPRHNTDCGERELRGERRRKGGRSLLATAAPSFFIPLLSLSTPLYGQRIEFGARLGAVFSSSLVEDRIATATARQLLGGAVDTLVRIAPGPALSAGAMVRVAFWPRAALEGTLDWAHGQLRADENGTARDLQPLDVVQATVGASWSVRDDVHIGGAVGLLRYITEERAIFAEGSDTSPLAEVRAAWQPPVLARRLGVTVRLQTHRFGAQALRNRGATDGAVKRVDVGLRVRLAEVGR
jgi:hypothetical protein